ncbi:hypothetical protein VPH35_005381 [Triticum aestivum]
MLVFLCIMGKDALRSLEETVLAFCNLSHLQELRIENCPPLAEKHLQILTSLTTLKIHRSSIMFPPLARSDARWKLPVQRLDIWSWSASGKELTRLLSHLPNLYCLDIRTCEKITRLGVEVEQQQTVAVDQQPEIEQEVEEEEVVMEQEEDDDGLLLLPAHLSDCLKVVHIGFFKELTLTTKKSGTGGGRLQAMRSLKKLHIADCPNFLSAYTASDDLSSCCPFPSSLRDLKLQTRSLQETKRLEGRMEGMGAVAHLSNLTSLKKLSICLGEDLRCEGLWHLLTQGQLTTLQVTGGPRFFVGLDPAQALQVQGEQEQSSSKLQRLETGDIPGVLAAPVCRFLSSSLTKLSFNFNEDVEPFRKEQEEALSLLTSLQELRFGWCDKLRRLPAGLNNLTNLKILVIEGCPAIRSLPKNGIPSSLEELGFEDCTSLQITDPWVSTHQVAAKEWPPQLAARVRCPSTQSFPK